MSLGPLCVWLSRLGSMPLPFPLGMNAARWQGEAQLPGCTAARERRPKLTQPTHAHLWLSRVLRTWQPAGLAAARSQQRGACGCAQLGAAAGDGDRCSKGGRLHANCAMAVATWRLQCSACYMRMLRHRALQMATMCQS